MAKRFTDSEIFEKTWFRKLNPEHKCFWFYCLAKCDIAGVVELDFEAATFFIGKKISKVDLKLFEGQFHHIKNDKFLIVDFIEFQYGSTLNEKSPVHKKVISILDKYSLFDRVSNRVSYSLQEEEEEKEEGKEEKKEEKKEYGNPEINECMAYFKERIPSIDGTVKNHRFACSNLIKKIKKEYPQADAVASVKLLIDGALNDDFHQKNVTNFSYILRNLNKIKNGIQQNPENEYRELREWINS